MPATAAAAAPATATAAAAAPSAPIPVVVVGATAAIPVAPATTTSGKAAALATPPASASAAAKKQPDLDADWAEASKRAKPAAARQAEQEGQLKQIKDQRDSREEDDSSSKKRAEWIGRQAGQAAYVGQRTGDVAVGMAGNSAAPAAGAAVEVASAGLAKLGPYGVAAAAALEGVAKVGGAAASAVDAFVQRGRAISAYSGDLTGASVNADLRSMQTDIREAQQLGPQLAVMIENQSKLEAITAETLRPIKSFLIETLNETMKMAMEIQVQFLNGLNVLLGLVKAESAAIKELVEKIVKLMFGEALHGDLMSMILKAGDKLEPKGDREAPAPANLGVPLLMGGR